MALNTLIEKKTTSTREGKGKGRSQLLKAISNLELEDIGILIKAGSRTGIVQPVFNPD